MADGNELILSPELLSMVDKLESKLQKLANTSEETQESVIGVFKELANGISNFDSILGDTSLRASQKIERIGVELSKLKKEGSGPINSLIDDISNLTMAVNAMSKGGVSDMKFIDTKNMQKELETLEKRLDKTVEKSKKYKYRLTQLEKNEGAPATQRDTEIKLKESRRDASRLRKEIKELRAEIDAATESNERFYQAMQGNQGGFKDIATLKDLRSVYQEVIDAGGLNEGQQQELVDKLSKVNSQLAESSTATETSVKRTQKSIQEEYADTIQEMNRLEQVLKTGKTLDGEVLGDKMPEQEIVLLENRYKDLSEKKKNIERNFAKDVEEIRRDSEIRSAETAISEAKRQLKEEERLRKEKEEKESTSYEGSLRISDSADTIEKERIAIQKLTKARDNLKKTDTDYETKLNTLNGRILQHNKNIERAARGSKDLQREHRSLMNIGDQLARRLALVFSVSQVTGYINKLVEVRGEFELQQRALQAILQNKDEADALWNKTIELAVQSPFRVKDLVSYTKQLAAYRIESDRLYETNKMLADISAGLGVDMQRLILAYGQVRSAAYLRGTELRQFTEAGIPILEELSKYFTEIEGKSVSIGDVFERVSKRMVGFKDVEEVLSRMTEAGGVFYKMQEIQAETMQGQISNLRDALDIMMSEIGKANESKIKGAIQTARSLVENWEKLIPIFKTLISLFAITKLNSLLAKESIMLQAIQVGVLTDASAKQLSIVQLLKTGWKSLGATIKGASTSMKGFASSNIWLLGLTVALGVIWKIVAAHREQQREIAEVNKLYDQMREKVETISVDFTVASTEGDIEGLKKQLMQLVNVANTDYHMDIVVDLKGMDAGEIEAKFIEIRQRIFSANAFANQFSVNLVDARGFEKNMEKLGQTSTQAMNTLIRDADRLSYALQEAERSQIGLTEQQSLALEKLSEPMSKDETQLEYLERLREGYELLFGDYSNYMDKLMETPRGNKENLENLQEQEEILERLGIDAIYLKNIFGGWDTSLQGTKTIFNNFLKTLNVNENLPIEQRTIELKTAIDKEATVKGLNDIQREYMYRWANVMFGTNIEVIKKKLSELPNFDEEEDKESRLNNIFNERVRVIKELYNSYKELNKTFDETTAKEGAIAKFGSAFEEAMAGLTKDGKQITLDTFDLFSEEGVKEFFTYLEKVAPTKASKIKAQLERGEITWDVNLRMKQEADKELDKQIENMFDQYELSLELDKLGLPKKLAKDLFDIDYTSLDELREKILSMEDQFTGTGRVKEYESLLEKINEMEDKAAVERMKTYSKYLLEGMSERVKLKVEEMKKLKEIEESKEFTPDQKQRISSNIQRETKEQLDKQEWEEFRKTPMYTMMFEDLESMGTKAIDTLKNKLNELKGSLNSLDPDDMREIMNQLEKIEDETIRRNPFEELKRSMEEIRRLEGEGRSEEVLQEEFALSQSRSQELQKQIDGTEALIAAKERGLVTDGESLDFLHQELAILKEEKAFEDSIGNNARKDLDSYIDARKALNALNEEWETLFNLASQGMDSIKSIMESLGVESDSVAMTLADASMSLIDLVAQGVSFYVQLQLMTTQATLLKREMNTALGPIGWVVLALQAVATVLKAILGSRDKMLKKQVEDAQYSVERLQKAFSDLEKEMDNAWSINQISSYNKKMEENLELQIKAQKAAISAQEQRKGANKVGSEEYKQLQEMKDALAEMETELVETWEGTFSKLTSGVLDSVHDAAREFTDAWYDAFVETGNGLSGLEDNFQEMLMNVAKQQATMQITGAFVDQWKESLGKYINKDDMELTVDEAKAWAEEVRASFPELNSALEAFLGVIHEGIGQGGSLSTLEKGIQGITESTAEVLASYLNSLRFYVADSNSKLTSLVQNMVGGDTESPMITELKAQTKWMKDIHSLLSGLTTTFPNGGRGFKVVM